MLTPAQILDKTITISKQKANLKWWQMLLLGIFAGMFIALAGIGSTFANIYGGKLAGALVFPIGLIMVVKLFTKTSLLENYTLTNKASLTR